MREAFAGLVVIALIPVWAPMLVVLVAWDIARAVRDEFVEWVWR
jgi:hypothetical protein